jgi:hypothetical protein
MSLATVATVATVATKPVTLIKQLVQGNVFYIESATGRVFTFHPTTPTHIGALVLLGDDEKHLISKMNGCLSHVRVEYLPDVKEIMARLRGNTETTALAISA